MKKIMRNFSSIQKCVHYQRRNICSEFKCLRCNLKKRHYDKEVELLNLVLQKSYQLSKQYFSILGISVFCINIKIYIRLCRHNEEAVAFLPSEVFICQLSLDLFEKFCYISVTVLREVFKAYLKKKIHFVLALSFCCRDRLKRLI